MKKIEVLNAFIDSELEAIDANAGHSGDWYAMNFRRLNKALVTAAPGLLDGERLLTFYSLLIRKGLLFEEPIRAYYPQWEEAYRRHLPWMVRKPWHAPSRIDRLAGLCCFGFDHVLTVGGNAGYEDYCLYRQATTPLSNNIPDILKKADKLLPFASDEKVVARTCAALTSLGFIVDDWYGVTSGEASYHYTHLGFASILLLLHLADSEQARQTLAEYAVLLPSLPQAEKQQAVLARCAEAARKFRPA